MYSDKYGRIYRQGCEVTVCFEKEGKVRATTGVGRDYTAGARSTRSPSVTLPHFLATPPAPYQQPNQVAQLVEGKWDRVRALVSRCEHTEAQWVQILPSLRSRRRGGRSPSCSTGVRMCACVRVPEESFTSCKDHILCTWNAKNSLIHSKLEVQQRHNPVIKHLRTTPIRVAVQECSVPIKSGRRPKQVSTITTLARPSWLGSLKLHSHQVRVRDPGAAVVKWSDYSSPTKTNQVRFPAGSLPAGRWSAGFLWDILFLPYLYYMDASYPPQFTLIGSKDVGIVRVSERLPPPGREVTSNKELPPANCISRDLRSLPGHTRDSAPLFPAVTSRTRFQTHAQTWLPYHALSFTDPVTLSNFSVKLLPISGTLAVSGQDKKSDVPVPTTTESHKERGFICCPQRQSAQLGTSLKTCHASEPSSALESVPPVVKALALTRQVQTAPITAIPSPVSLLASHQGDPGSIPGRATALLHVGIVPGDAVGRWVFSRISRSPRPFIPAPLHMHLNHPSLLLKTALGRRHVSTVGVDQRRPRLVGSSGTEGGVARIKRHMFRETVEVTPKKTL
ncbi:hypothetical protein PR048_003049 [Dryococelus australis]|uniref:Uncharacterized protein n=1 Tax=Dryococelus australis TaxID=614101 RepID=A0ABQ9INC4_9NEOP|nr:hypothetical protein PR048_003049 [Dryococelus australis]